MNISRRHLLILLPAAAVAWKFVEAGTPEASPNYQMSEHWWGMLIDIPNSSAVAIACGPAKRKTTCPMAISAPGLSATMFRTRNMTTPEVISPDGGKEGFPVATGRRGQVLFRSEDVQPLRRLALHAGMSGGRHIHQSGRRGAGGSDLLSGPVLLRAGLPV